MCRRLLLVLLLMGLFGLSLSGCTRRFYRTRADMEVDDILQEVFLAAARDMKQFTYQSPGSLMRWLSRIAEAEI